MVKRQNKTVLNTVTKQLGKVPCPGDHRSRVGFGSFKSKLHDNQGINTQTKIPVNHITNAIACWN